MCLGLSAVEVTNFLYAPFIISELTVSQNASMTITKMVYYYTYDVQHY